MRVFGKIMMSAAAFALAGGLVAASAQAMPMLGKPGAASTIQLVAEKKKVPAKKTAAKKPAKKVAKKVAKKGPGSCGTMMYWDKKAHKCADATQKKSS
jgi:hypothetical protein